MADVDLSTLGGVIKTAYEGQADTNALTDAKDAAITANSAKVTNATHTGDVTGFEALTIADGVVDLANLSATGTKDATTFLRGDNTFAAPPADAVDSVAGETGVITDVALRTALNVEDGADVTDAANVEAAIEAITLTAITGATGDEVMVVDATDGGLKAVLWENLPSGGTGDAWGDPVDANIVPDADGTRNLGADLTRFANVFTDRIEIGTVVLDGTTLADPAADRLLFWDDSAGETAYLTPGNGLTIATTTITADVESVAGETGAITAGALRTALNVEDGADVTDAANVETAIEAITLSPVTGATGDEVMVVDATDGGLKAVLWENLPGSGGGIASVVEDTTPQLGGDLDAQGNEIANYTNAVISATGTLTLAAHSGNVVLTTGNVTVPTTAGFTATLIAGGAHTVTFNATTSAAMAAGDIMSVVVEDATTIQAVLTAAADKVSFA